MPSAIDNAVAPPNHANCRRVRCIMKSPFCAGFPARPAAYPTVGCATGCHNSHTTSPEWTPRLCVTDSSGSLVSCPVVSMHCSKPYVASSLSHSDSRRLARAAASRAHPDGVPITRAHRNRRPAGRTRLRCLSSSATRHRASWRGARTNECVGRLRRRLHGRNGAGCFRASTSSAATRLATRCTVRSRVRAPPVRAVPVQRGSARSASTWRCAGRSTAPHRADVEGVSR